MSLEIIFKANNITYTKKIIYVNNDPLTLMNYMITQLQLIT